MHLSDGWSWVIYRERDFPAEVVETWERLALDYATRGFSSAMGGSGTGGVPFSSSRAMTSRSQGKQGDYEQKYFNAVLLLSANH